MAFCDTCNRSFRSEESLQQHLRYAAVHSRLALPEPSERVSKVEPPPQYDLQMRPGLLCDWCLRLFDGNPARYASGHETKHRKLIEFKESATHGCLMCSRVWGEADATKRTRADEVTFRALGSIWGGSNGSAEEPTTFQLMFICFPPEGAGGTQSIFFRAFSSQGRCIFSCLYRRGIENQPEPYLDYPWDIALPDETSSSQTLDMAKMWAQSCSKDHLECSKHQDSGWYPTRLIEIDPKTKDFWRLRHPAKDKIEVSKYMTLSYRWSKQPFYKLTTRGLADFQSGQPIADLPQTFQDAMTVAKHFDVRYLWIDALCIIQDSEDDWETECAAMCQVYSNTYCNILATASTDPSGGLFRRRDPHNIQIASITPKWEHYSPTGQALRSIDTLIPDDLFRKEIDSSVLDKRGWIVQERVLPPRVLHFADSQVHFECHLGQKCEAMPGGLPKDLDYGRVGSPTYNPSEQWNYLLQQFTECALTKPGDKLTALSGLADRYARLLNDTYVAGLWLSHIPWELTWKTYGGASRPKNYRAPSWSWASVDGTVYPSGREETQDAAYYAEVIKVEIQPAVNELAGQALYLRAPSIVVTARADEKWKGFWMIKGSEHTRFGAHIQGDADEEFQAGTVVHLLLTLSMIKDDRPLLSGLVLRAAPKAPDAYVRVGTFSHELNTFWSDNMTVRGQFSMWGIKAKDASYTFDVPARKTFRIL
jgi:hypothetical protein